MTAPAAISHPAALAALDDAVALLRVMVQRRRTRQAAVITDTAGSVRPPCVGDRRTQQEGRTLAGKLNGATFVEDGQHEPPTL